MKWWGGEKILSHTIEVVSEESNRIYQKDKNKESGPVTETEDTTIPIDI